MIADKEYEKQRDALIPKAVKHANAVCGIVPGKGRTGNQTFDISTKWNRAYFGKMDELARAKGLIN